MGNEGSERGCRRIAIVWPANSHNILWQRRCVTATNKLAAQMGLRRAQGRAQQRRDKCDSMLPMDTASSTQLRVWVWVGGSGRASSEGGQLCFCFELSPQTAKCQQLVITSAGWQVAEGRRTEWAEVGRAGHGVGLQPTLGHILTPARYQLLLAVQKQKPELHSKKKSQLQYQKLCFLAMPYILYIYTYI